MDKKDAIAALDNNGYLTARLRLALWELVRIFEKDNAKVVIKVDMLTKAKNAKQTAAVSIKLSLPRFVLSDQLLESNG